MATLAHVTDHVAQALALRLRQDKKDKPLDAAWLSIDIDRLQRIEDVLLAIYAAFDVDTAVGDQLEALGEIVGEKRKGRADELYRLWVKARIVINRSNGKVHDLLKITRIVLGSDPLVTYTPDYPMAFRIDIVGSTPNVPTLVAILEEARAGGVKMHVTYTDDPLFSFTFADDDSPELLDTDRGFAPDDESTGGKFADAA